MSLRIVNLTTLAWWLLALQIGPAWWSSITAVSAQNPPPGPKTVEAQAKFFQYMHAPTHEDYDQGHRQGSDRHFTERHERARPSTGLFSAKVRWGDKKGGYGEHYWDLNHAGHNNDNDHDHDHESYEHSSDDDGSYHPEASDPYDEPSEQLPTYNSDDAYDPEKSSKSVYDESGRNKRAQPRLRVDRKPQEYQEEHKPETQRVYRPRNHKERKTQNIAKTTPKYVHDESNNEEVTEQPKEHKQNIGNKLKINVDDNIEDTKEVKKPSLEESFPNVPNRPKAPYVPYATGAGVRQYNPELTAASAPPRLFLDPSTGHIVDRSTGQAYVLQPLRANNYN
ncbi:uncharacterized protein LOC105382767 isoform X2 [Plutella xylostella]|uniref:uncharacterized protein LOC105382767 isoform X2 n=1 Tax=Plutella xylostella TaxID=51655 RepID=UPI0020324C40|nr:uncharacterized protein LOC105382767 isoform X2 [Plutella xylostella]